MILGKMIPLTQAMIGIFKKFLLYVTLDISRSAWYQLEVLPKMMMMMMILKLYFWWFDSMNKWHYKKHWLSDDITRSPSNKIKIYQIDIFIQRWIWLTVGERRFDDPAADKSYWDGTQITSFPQHSGALWRPESETGQICIEWGKCPRDPGNWDPALTLATGNTDYFHGHR